MGDALLPAFDTPTGLPYNDLCPFHGPNRSAPGAPLGPGEGESTTWRHSVRGTFPPEYLHPLSWEIPCTPFFATNDSFFQFSSGVTFLRLLYSPGLVIEANPPPNHSLTAPHPRPPLFSGCMQTPVEFPHCPPPCRF